MTPEERLKANGAARDLVWPSFQIWRGFGVTGGLGANDHGVFLEAPITGHTMILTNDEIDAGLRDKAEVVHARMRRIHAEQLHARRAVMLRHVPKPVPARGDREALYRELDEALDALAAHDGNFSPPGEDFDCTTGAC